MRRSCVMITQRLDHICHAQFVGRFNEYGIQAIIRFVRDASQLVKQRFHPRIIVGFVMLGIADAAFEKIELAELWIVESIFDRKINQARRGHCIHRIAKIGLLKATLIG